MVAEVRRQLEQSLGSLGIGIGGPDAVPRPLPSQLETHVLGAMDGVLLAALYPNIARVCTAAGSRTRSQSLQFAPGKKMKIMVCAARALMRSSMPCIAAVADAAGRPGATAHQLHAAPAVRPRCRCRVLPARADGAAVPPHGQHHWGTRADACVACHAAQLLPLLFFAGSQLTLEPYGSRTLVTIDDERWIPCVLEAGTAAVIKARCRCHIARGSRLWRQDVRAALEEIIQTALAAPQQQLGGDALQLLDLAESLLNQHPR